MALAWKTIVTQNRDTNKSSVLSKNKIKRTNNRARDLVHVQLLTLKLGQVLELSADCIVPQTFYQTIKTQKPKHHSDHEIRSVFGAQWRVHHPLSFTRREREKQVHPASSFLTICGTRERKEPGLSPNKRLSDPPPLLLASQNPSVSWSYVEIVVQDRLITKETTLPARVDINLGSPFS